MLWPGENRGESLLLLRSPGSEQQEIYIIGEHHGLVMQRFIEKCSPDVIRGIFSILISLDTIDSEWNILLSKDFQGSLGHEMLTGAEHTARETT